MCRVAILTALPMELQPLVKGWARSVRRMNDRDYTVYETQEVVAMAGGMGAEAARRATEAIIQTFAPHEIISAGLCGALVPELKVAEVLWPRVVMNSRDGTRQDRSGGYGVLLSHPAVVDCEGKKLLATQYGAQIVDMEASAVARGCSWRVVDFRAVKSVSDDLQFSLPPMDRFVGSEGEFKTFAFVLTTLVHPTWWLPVIQLGLNSARAARSLAEALRVYLSNVEAGPAPTTEAT